MTTITFDKLAYIEHLKTAGVDETHARAHAFALDDALKDTVATKNDVKDVRNEISALKSEMRELELRMTVKVGTMMFVSVGIIITAMRFMFVKGL